MTTAFSTSAFLANSIDEASSGGSTSRASMDDGARLSGVAPQPREAGARANASGEPSETCPTCGAPSDSDPNCLGFCRRCFPTCSQCGNDGHWYESCLDPALQNMSVRTVGWIEVSEDETAACVVAQRLCPDCERDRTSVEVTR